MNGAMSWSLAFPQGTEACGLACVGGKVEAEIVKAESGNGTTRLRDWRRERARLPRRAETAGLMEFDLIAWAAYSFCMNAVEFTTELTGAAVLPIPREIAAQLPKSGKARILVLTDDATDEAEWRAGAYEQFLRDDSAEDAIYDSLR
jgi:hypothetical protein